MRNLFGCLGALAGGIFGAFFGLSLAFLFAGGNTLIISFFGMIGVPLGFALGLAGGIFLGKRFSEFWQSDVTQRQRILALITVILTPLLMSIGLAAAVYQTNSPPSDKTLLAHFEKHHSTFEILAKMAQEDPELMRVGDTWTSPENPATINIANERIAVYRKLFKQVGIPNGLRRQKGEDFIEFTYYSWGSAVSSDIFKGFVYCPTPPAPILDSLDDERKPHAFRHITGNWYLYYLYISG